MEVREERRRLGSRKSFLAEEQKVESRKNRRATIRKKPRNI
jgi:hypothetical protein